MAFSAKNRLYCKDMADNRTQCKTTIVLDTAFFVWANDTAKSWI